LREALNLFTFTLLKSFVFKSLSFWVLYLKPTYIRIMERTTKLLGKVVGEKGVTIWRAIFFGIGCG
jgi:hypothetical protein